MWWQEDRDVEYGKNEKLSLGKICKGVDQYLKAEKSGEKMLDIKPVRCTEHMVDKVKERRKWKNVNTGLGSEWWERQCSELEELERKEDQICCIQKLKSSVKGTDGQETKRVE